MNDEQAMKDLKTLVHEVMGLDIDSVEQKRNLAEIDEWDSFNNLMLISKCEDHYGIKFGVKDIEDIDTVQKLRALILEKVGGA